ncbi:MAG: extracellular solute-binding protein [Dongiaceae bacterium]
MQPDTGTVTILTWETYQDDAPVAAYAKKAGVEVKVIRAGSVDEMYAQTRSGAIKPDVIYFDTGSIPRYIQADLVEPIDFSRVPNIKNIMPSLDWKTFNHMSGAVYGIPYCWGTQPLMYDADKMPEPKSWGALWDPKHTGKVSTFDDAYVNIPMIALYCRVKDPYKLTDADFETVSEALRRLRPQIRAISSGYDDMASKFLAGDAEIAYCQNISIGNDLRGRGRNVQVTYPEEGTPAWVDNAVLTRHSGQRKEVYDFVNHCLSLDWQVKFISDHGGNGVISEAEARANGVPAAVIEKTEIASAVDPKFWARMSVLQTPEDFDKRLEIWNAFKSGTL